MPPKKRRHAYLDVPLQFNTPTLASYKLRCGSGPSLIASRAWTERLQRHVAGADEG